MPRCGKPLTSCSPIRCAVGLARTRAGDPEKLRTLTEQRANRSRTQTRYLADNLREFARAYTTGSSGSNGGATVFARSTYSTGSSASAAEARSQPFQVPLASSGFSLALLLSASLFLPALLEVSKSGLILFLLLLLPQPLKLSRGH